MQARDPCTAHAPVFATFFILMSKGLNTGWPCADPLVKALLNSGLPAACREAQDQGC